MSEKAGAGGAFLVTELSLGTVYRGEGSHRVSGRSGPGPGPGLPDSLLLTTVPLCIPFSVLEIPLASSAFLFNFTGNTAPNTMGKAPPVV